MSFDLQVFTVLLAFALYFAAVLASSLDPKSAR